MVRYIHIRRDVFQVHGTGVVVEGSGLVCIPSFGGQDGVRESAVVELQHEAQKNK